jgi:flavin reductase (DIM6/NTAB) family NADH-FMN oxidoreductase RutF
MLKKRLGRRMPSLTLPVCILGSNYEGKANFCTVAWFTMIDDEPPTIGLLLGKKRRTVDGIRQNRTFSVNLPSTKLAAKTDFVGLYSGYKEDKSEVFRVSYGQLGNAPLVDDCPMSVECKLKDIIEFEGTDLVIGEIVEVHVDEECLTDEEPDIVKMDPLLYGSPGAAYFQMGNKVADAFKVGKKLKVPNRKKG